jgi:hypothetical protein
MAITEDVGPESTYEVHMFFSSGIVKITSIPITHVGWVNPLDQRLWPL